MKIKRMAVVIVFCFFGALSLPAPASAAFLIELEHGSFVTNHYWEENGQIKYMYRGGIVGVDKNKVKSITDTEASVSREIHPDPTPPPEAPTVEPSAEEGQGEDPAEIERKMSKLRDDLRINVSRALHYRDQYQQAREANDEEGMAEAFDRLKELSTEEGEIREEVRGLLDGDLPDWWEEIIDQ